jgi:hypothetical protein
MLSEKHSYSLLDVEWNVLVRRFLTDTLLLLGRKNLQKEGYQYVKALFSNPLCITNYGSWKKLETQIYFPLQMESCEL